MRWIMAHVSGVGPMVFQAEPGKMYGEYFEFSKGSVVVMNQSGQIGLSKLVGDIIGAVGKVGCMNRSAVAFWQIIEDNGFQKSCEDAWARESIRSGLVMPTPEAAQAIRNGKGLRLT